MEYCVPKESPRIISEALSISSDMVNEIAAVARPFRSPLMTPQKRSAPDELFALDNVSSPAKCAKRSAPRLQSECFNEEKHNVKSELGQRTTLEEAVKRAIGFYKDLWILQTIEEECGYPRDEDTREDRSGLACEEWAKENYEAIRVAVNALLPWAGGVEPAGPDADYDVLQFHGLTPPKSKKKISPEEKWLEKRQIRDYRNSSEEARAREALVTLCSALSCRREKLWVEFAECGIVDVVKKSGFRRVKSQKMVALITDFINDLTEKGHWCCQFAACALLRAESYIRIAFGRGLGYSIPASILIVHRMPLWKVFDKMEEDSPFCGAAKARAWWNRKGREVAFQKLNFAETDINERNERLPVSSLMPDSQIKKLLLSQTPVVYLDMLAALSTREASKKFGLSNIVKGELAMLFKEAKSKGEAVIFVLGASDPRKLAEKVYLRPPLNEWGLQCGYFRWRASPDESWAREKEYSDRSCFMLQMP